jgi:hypothetical protein
MGWFKIHGAAIAAAALLSAGVAAADTFRWITYKPEGAGDAQTRSTKWFVEEFAKRTGGKHRIQVFWGGSVAKTGEVPNALGAGLGDFGDVVTPYFPDRFPLNNAVGFFIPQPHGILKIAELLEGWHKTHPQFEQELSRAKLKVVGWRPLEEYGLLCNKPVLLRLCLSSPDQRHRRDARLDEDRGHLRGPRAQDPGLHADRYLARQGLEIRRGGEVLHPISLRGILWSLGGDESGHLQQA